MKHELIARAQHTLPIFLLALIIGLLIGANYSPGTILSGWDTLHPEFNFPLAFERAINGVWRDNQGLGAVAGHSHMAELPRLALLWVGSLIVPTNLIRYAFIFGSLITGVIGAYYLVKNLLRNSAAKELFAFVGALVYLANLGTIQHFIVPFEMFAVAYAFLPWLFLSSKIYIERQTKRSFFLFLLVTILISPMAFAATLWYATYAAFFLFILTITAFQKLKFAFIIILTSLFLNAYWIGPNIYFVLTHGTEVQESKINRLFSEEAFAKNQKFGRPQDAVILRNFLFDWQIYEPATDTLVDVMTAWKTHLNNPFVISIGYGVFVISLAGVALAMMKKDRYMIGFIPVYGISFLMLLNGTYPMNTLFEFFGTQYPVVAEALRFPFTKFSLLTMVSISIFSAYGLAIIYEKLHIFRTTRLILPILVSGLLLWYFSPAFTGNLIHQKMRIDIPMEYYDMFRWFEKQDKHGIVANLPIHSFWGWMYYDWGFQGAGFTQFGIPQPFLDRDFDRWSTYNEQYGQEMAYAIYSQNPEIIKHVLNKYTIRWVLLDTSVISPGNVAASTLTWRIPELLERTGIVRPAEIFGDTIFVYEVVGNHSLIDTSSDANIAQSTTIQAISETIPATNSSMTSLSPIYQERYQGELIGTIIGIANTTTQEMWKQDPYCYQKTTPVLSHRKFLNTSVYYETVDVPLCDYVGIPDLVHDTGYIVTVTSKHISGFPLGLCISNNLTRHCDIYTHLHQSGDMKQESFYIPPHYDLGLGYTINLSNYMVNGPSINEIQSIEIRQIIPTLNPDMPTYETPSRDNTRVQTRSLTSWLMLTTIDTNTQTTLILNRGYEQGWHAYSLHCVSNNLVCRIQSVLPFIFGYELPGHVEVQGWANGWTLPYNPEAYDQQRIMIVFWPQFLQFFGFLFLPLPLLFFLLKKS